MSQRQAGTSETHSGVMEVPIELVRVRTNGISLQVAQAGAVDGPLVLLLHGFPEYWEAWRRTIPALAAAGYRVWAPDQRGYNQSDKPAEMTAYTLDHLSDDVAGLLDAAGVEPAAIVGHDWGASVAWWTANRYPERVARMVAINAPHPVAWLRRIRASWSQRLKSSYMAFFQMPWLPEALLGAGSGAGLARSMKNSARPGTFSDADLARYRAAWSQPGALTAMLNWYRALRQEPSLPELRIRPPVLIIWGTEDAFAERAVAEESAALCDQATVEYIEGASHWVHHEEPERVNRLLLQFLAASG